MQPGIYDIGEDEYHADPCPTPSLSNSIAVTMIDQSPIHAWAKHPKLNPNYEAEERGIFDTGSAAHALVIEGVDRIEVIDAKDWKTKAAKEARDAARDNGKIPMLPDGAKDVRAMAEAFYLQVNGIPEIAAAIKSFKGEQTVLWQEGEVWCRCRPDILPDDGPIVLDYKTTTNAHPSIWSASRLYEGPDMQDAFYTRGLKAVGRDFEKMVFIVQETKFPYALSAVAVSPEGRDSAAARVSRSIRMWQRCLSRNDWPGYPSMIFHGDPTWRSDKRRGVADDVQAFTGRDALETAIKMQTPTELTQ